MVHVIVPVLRVGAQTNTVDSIQSLQFIVGDANNETIVVLGSTFPGDGGSQSFRWVANSTKDGDNIFTVRPVGQVMPGRWEAVLSLPSGVTALPTPGTPIPVPIPVPVPVPTPGAPVPNPIPVPVPVPVPVPTDPTFVAILSPTSNAAVSGVIPVVVQGTSPLKGVTLADINNNTLAAGQFNPLNIATINLDSAILGAGQQVLRALAYDVATPPYTGFTTSRATQVILNVTVPSTPNPGTTNPGTPSPSPTPSPTPAPTPTPPPATFTDPRTQTSGLEAWYDFASGNSITSVGGNITRANDLTTNSHTLLTTATGPAWAGNAIGGLSAARYTGGFNVFLFAQGSSGNIQNMWSSGGTMMAVMYARSNGSATGTARLFDKSDDVATGWYVQTTANNIVFAVNFTSSAETQWRYPAIGQFSFGNNMPFILELDYNSSQTSSVPTFRVNGTIQTVSTTINTPPTGVYKSDTNNFLVMSAFQGDWDWGSALIWSKTLSDDQRAAVRSYLSTRWNIGVAPSTTPSTNPTNPNTPVQGGGSQPSSVQDIVTASVPAVSAQSNNGWGCVGDFTFGSSNNITGFTSFNNHCVSQYPGGVSRLNDEWEFYTNVALGQLSCHSFQTDHLQLKAIVNNTTKFNAQVARCLATTGVGTPDGHDWGSWQNGTGGPAGFDCGVSSGMIWYQRTQKYGYFEWKVQVPSSQSGGAWPACWMVDGGTGTANNGGPTRNWPPEVDVLEMAINNAPDNSFNSFHNKATGNPVPAVTTVSGLLDQFGSYHGGFDQSASPTLYATLWQQPTDPRGDSWQIWVNNVCVWSGFYQWAHSDGSPAGVAYFYTNLAYGGNWPGRLGAASNINNLPVTFKVYYFRMFAK